jgi:hypothetical protein
LARLQLPFGVPYGDLIRYPLSLPGVTCAVVGIGRINREKPEADQLACSLAAAMMDLPDAAGRLRIERLADVRLSIFPECARFERFSLPDQISPAPTTLAIA